MKPIVLIGYSGHAFVVCDILNTMQWPIAGYCEQVEKKINPYKLEYFGRETENSTIEKLQKQDYFVAIGDNHLRAKITVKMEKILGFSASTIIHKTAWISPTAELGTGCMLSGGVQVNACAKVGKSVILNTSSIIEHECEIGDFAHIAPGVVLCGNVQVGENTFIGSNAVVKQGVKIGRNVTIGAGTVVLRDISDNARVVGNPQRIIEQ